MDKHGEVPKLVRDGKVAVLVSYGFGAGWSTWASEEVKEAMVFSPLVAEAVLGEGLDVGAAAKEAFPEVYAGGVEGLAVNWVDEGTDFRITEYDGSESLEIIDQIEHYTA